MRGRSLLPLLALLLAASCARGKEYPLEGQIIGVDTAQQVLTVTHKDIPGFMPGMTMPFKVRNAAEMEHLRPGDLITATLAVEDSVGYLEGIAKTGEAPLPEKPQRAPLKMIEPGAEVPDAEFVDQQGKTPRFSDFRGRTVAVTFVYTRCPLPNFCPLMDRNFQAVQRALEADPGLAGRVHLLSVSFDPEYDTPDVLRKHAERIGANPKTWSYVTGASTRSVDAFAEAFGVSVIRPDQPLDEIVHNLRTAVVDVNGRLVTVLNGNEWKPEDLLDAIRAADAKR